LRRSHPTREGRGGGGGGKEKRGKKKKGKKEEGGRQGGQRFFHLFSYFLITACRTFSLGRTGEKKEGKKTIPPADGIPFLLAPKGRREKREKER